jgi:DNA-binding transcriptional ArsR family regulator
MFVTVKVSKAADHPALRPSADVLGAAVEVFKALGNPQRLSIIHALSHAELSVGELARGVRIPITTASQHLAILRRLRLVAGRDDGRLTYYRVIDDVVSHLVHDCLVHCGGDEHVAPTSRKRGGRR